MADQIKTVSDMMKALQEEIEAVKSGTLTESQARLVFTGRKLQLKNAELNLQFQRLQLGVKPKREMKLVEGEREDETKKPALFSGA